MLRQKNRTRLENNCFQEETGCRAKEIAKFHLLLTLTNCNFFRLVNVLVIKQI